MIGVTSYLVTLAMSLAILSDGWRGLGVRPSVAQALIVLGACITAWSGSAPSWSSAVLGSLVATLVVSAVTDLATGLIFDRTSIVGSSLILIESVAGGRPIDAVAGAAVALVPMAAIYLLTRGRGLGLGDVKLAALIGLGVGSAQALRCIGLSFVAGAAYGAALLIVKRADPRTPVPFAPFLAAGTLFSVVCLGGNVWAIG